MPEGRTSAAERFLAQHRIAVVGVSRDPKGFSRWVFRELLKRGYDAVPVNPNTSEIKGKRCFASVREVEPRPDGALIILPSGAIEGAVRDSIEAGVRRVWVWGVLGPKRVDPRVSELCRDNGVELVAGYCPYMFLPGTAWFHRLHGWIALRTAGEPQQMRGPVRS
jgi:predicted CoA-binding protein